MVPPPFGAIYAPHDGRCSGWGWNIFHYTLAFVFNLLVPVLASLSAEQASALSAIASTTSAPVRTRAVVLLWLQPFSLLDLI